MTDPLDMTLRALLERLLAPATDADPWLDARKQELVAWRELSAAAKRGELELFRVGRRVLVRKSELDRWIARPQHRVGPDAAPGAADKYAAVAHMLERNGYRRRSATPEPPETEDEREREEMRRKLGMVRKDGVPK